MPLDAKYTPIYLNDHLAGSTVGVALAKRTLGSNRDTQFEPFLERLEGRSRRTARRCARSCAHSTL